MQNRSNIQLNSELIRKKTTLMPVNLTKNQIYARPTKNNPNNQLINLKKNLNPQNPNIKSHQLDTISIRNHTYHENEIYERKKEQERKIPDIRS